MKHKKSVAKICFHVCSVCTMLGEIGINFQRLKELYHIFLQVQRCISTRVDNIFEQFPLIALLLKKPPFVCLLLCVHEKVTYDFIFLMPNDKRL